MSSSDEKDKDKDTTSVGSAAAPKLPGQRAAGGETAPADTTRSTAAQPPKLPSAPPAGGPAKTESGDSTVGAGAAPPKLPGAGGSAAAGEQPRPEREEQVEVFRDEPTVLQVQTASERFKLLRVQPQGHTGVVPLERARYSLGRSRSNDIRLYSDSASRTHAEIVQREEDWFVRPLEEKIVLANGTRVRDELQLEHRMLLQFGGDELVFLDDEAALRDDTTAPPARAGSTRRLWPWVLAAAIVVIAVSMVLFLLLKA